MVWSIYLHDFCMTCTEPQVEMLGISQLGLGTAKKSLSFFGMLRRVERLCRTTIELSCSNLGIHRGLSNARWQALAGGRLPRADFNLRQTILDQFGAADVPLGGGTYALGSLRCVPPSSDELVCVTSAICRIPRQFAISPPKVSLSRCLASFLVIVWPPGDVASPIPASAP